MAKRQVLSLAPDREHGSDVLLAKYATDTYSPVFSVVDTPVRLIAFGLSEEAGDPDEPFAGELAARSDKVFVLRVWYPEGRMERDGCGKLLPAGEWFEEPLRINMQRVALTLQQNEVVLDGVGYYRVMYAGIGRENVQVVYMRDAVVRVDPQSRIGGW